MVYDKVHLVVHKSYRTKSNLLGGPEMQYGKSVWIQGERRWWDARLVLIAGNWVVALNHDGN